MADKKDRERRSKNVSIFGVTVSNKTSEEERLAEDKDNLKEIFEQIGISTRRIASFHRFKSKPNQTFSSPILVKLGSESDRNEIIAAAKKLKRSGNRFARMYMNPDMTEVERNLDKDLRNARHERNKNESDANYR